MRKSSDFCPAAIGQHRIEFLRDARVGKTEAAGHVRNWKLDVFEECNVEQMSFQAVLRRQCFARVVSRNSTPLAVACHPNTCCPRDHAIAGDVVGLES